MAGHRHLSRAAAPHAIHLIIGKLREHYPPPQELPREMRQLLTKLDEGDQRASWVGQRTDNVTT